MAKNKTPLHPDAPLLLNDHRRPVTRRELIAQGFKVGGATLLGGPLLSLLAQPAFADNAADIKTKLAACGIQGNGAGKIPFICFDLAGGGNLVGSNVLVGQKGGQLDFLTTAGYSKQGLPAAMAPNASTPTVSLFDQTMGLAFQADSAILRGIKTRVKPTTEANTNGAVICARSENDTSNNPHNPMYGIAKAGAKGSLLSLVGSVNSDSGGNSMSPAGMIDLTLRPTKVDSPADAVGLSSATDDPNPPLAHSDMVLSMESMYRLSEQKLSVVNTGTTDNAALKEALSCGYAKSAWVAENFSQIGDFDPSKDTNIVGVDGSSIFTQAEFASDGEFRKTASVMKLVVNGLVGAGTITMGGFDYHTGDRSTGEMRDFRLGKCIGACLEYAARKNMPLMVYVFSDGSVASNGMMDNTIEGRGKGVWTNDDQQTASTFFLVYNPGHRPVLMGATAAEQAVHQQIGFFRPTGDVETSSSPAGNNVNLLVETVVMNYMALHGQQGDFKTVFPTNGLGNSTLVDKLTAFQPICNKVITSPV